MIALDQGGAALSSARLVAPPPHLAAWVSQAWSDESAGSDWRIVADDAPHLIYSELVGAEGMRSRLSLVGPRSIFVQIDRAPRLRTLAARLRPGSLLPLFGVAGHELLDCHVSLDLVVGSSAADQWRDRIRLAAPTDFDPLWQVLIQQSRSAPSGQRSNASAVDWRVRQALRADRQMPAGGSLSAIADRMGLSSRTLRRVFRDQVGLSPIHALRVRRLHRALLDSQSTGSAGWSAIAARCGYSDQSHLIRDCRELLGETPGRFMARRVRAVA